MNPGFILADDLSGALEAGVAFRACGWRTVVPCKGARMTTESSVVRVISTETRLATPAVAQARVRELLQTQAGARLLFKKIDSTLRGPLGAELQAVAVELQPHILVVCPANPVMRRTVINGEVRIGGVPLEQTDFRHDPAWPAFTGSIQERLAAQGVMTHGIISLKNLRSGALISTLARLPAVSTRVIVSDAETVDDLLRLVRETRAWDPAAAFVGSAALGAALALTLVPPGQVEEPSPRCTLASLLILCGSRHPASHRQLSALLTHGAAVVLEVDLTQSPAAFARALLPKLQANAVFALRADPAIAYEAAELTDWLGNLVLALDTAGGLPDGLVLTGGETAFAVCRQLRGTALWIEGQPALGLVEARLERENAPSITVFTKPGGFGTDSVLLDLVREMK